MGCRRTASIARRPNAPRVPRVIQNIGEPTHEPTTWRTEIDIGPTAVDAISIASIRSLQLTTMRFSFASGAAVRFAARGQVHGICLSIMTIKQDECAAFCVIGAIG